MLDVEAELIDGFIGLLQIYELWVPIAPIHRCILAIKCISAHKRY